MDQSRKNAQTFLDISFGFFNKQILILIKIITYAKKKSVILCEKYRKARLKTFVFLQPRVIVD